MSSTPTRTTSTDERYTSSCRRVSRSELILNPKSKVAILITKMWETLGDRIALQYGGSEAHKKVTGQVRFQFFLFLFLLFGLMLFSYFFYFFYFIFGRKKKSLKKFLL